MDETGKVIPVKIKLKVNQVTSVHVGCSLFIDDLLCGNLAISHRGYQRFAAALALGISQMEGLAIDESDETVLAEYLERGSYNQAVHGVEAE